MTNKITLKRSSQAAKVPEPGDLDYGELALNFTDGNLFFKSNANVITTLASTKFVSVTGNVTGGNIVTAGQITATGNITGTNIRAIGGSFFGDGSGLTGISTTGGYFNSTLTTFPTGDYGNGEPFVEEGTTQDAFGVTIVPNFSCMDPQGSITPAIDLGAL
jgi:hypothetical protein